MSGKTVRRMLTLEELSSGITIALDADDDTAPTFVVEPGMPCSVRVEKKICRQDAADHYVTLSQGDITVTKSSGPETIKKAFRKLMLTWHPDRVKKPLTWGEWEDLRIEHHNDVAAAVGSLRGEVLVRLAAGVEGSEGLPHPQTCIAEAGRQKARMVTQINEANSVLSDRDKKFLYDNPPRQAHSSTCWAVRISLESAAQREARGESAFHRVDWDRCVDSGLPIAEALRMVEALGNAGLLAGADDTSADIQQGHKDGADLLLIKCLTIEQAMRGLDGDDARLDLPSGRSCALGKGQAIENGFCEIIENEGLPKYRDPAGARGRVIVQYHVEPPAPTFAAKIGRAAVAGQELIDSTLDMEKCVRQLESELQVEHHAWAAENQEHRHEIQKLRERNASQAQLMQHQKQLIEEQHKKMQGRRGLLSMFTGLFQQESVDASESPADAPKSLLALLGSYSPLQPVQRYSDAHCTDKLLYTRDGHGRTMLKNACNSRPLPRVIVPGREFDATAVGQSFAADGSVVTTLLCNEKSSARSLGWIKYDAKFLEMTSAASGQRQSKQRLPDRAVGTTMIAQEAGMQQTTEPAQEAVMQRLQDQLQRAERDLATLKQSMVAKDLELDAKDRRFDAKELAYRELQAQLDTARRERQEDTDWGRQVLDLVIKSGLCPDDFLHDLPMDADSASLDIRPIRDDLLSLLQTSIDQRDASIAQSVEEMQSFCSDVNEHAATLHSILVTPERQQSAAANLMHDSGPISAANSTKHLSDAVARVRAELEMREQTTLLLQAEVIEHQQRYQQMMEDWQRNTCIQDDAFELLSSRDVPHCMHDDHTYSTGRTLDQLRAQLLRARTIKGLEDLGSMARLHPCHVHGVTDRIDEPQVVRAATSAPNSPSTMASSEEESVTFATEHVETVPVLQPGTTTAHDGVTSGHQRHPTELEAQVANRDPSESPEEGVPAEDPKEELQRSDPVGQAPNSSEIRRRNSAGYNIFGFAARTA